MQTLQSYHICKEKGFLWGALSFLPKNNLLFTADFLLKNDLCRTVLIDNKTE